MKTRQGNTRRIIDIGMTVLLLLQMAYQVMGEAAHEWLGMAMTALVIVHQILNRRWYGAMLKGRYTAYRVASTCVNVLLLASFALTAFCGMAMSNYAVPFMYGVVRVSFVRVTHLSMSHWSFVLMGLHLGLHVPVMLARLRLKDGARRILSVVCVGVAREIQRQTGFDLFEIEPIPAYSDDYDTVLVEAQRDQHAQARPEIAGLPENLDVYDTILLGYPNWWASIPMPIASFLEAFDFSGKRILPFCSHGGGRFGQSLTAIAKLAPQSNLGQGLSIHYSGGSTLSEDVAAWLEENGIY